MQLFVMDINYGYICDIIVVVFKMNSLSVDDWKYRWFQNALKDIPSNNQVFKKRYVRIIQMLHLMAKVQSLFRLHRVRRKTT